MSETKTTKPLSIGMLLLPAFNSMAAHAFIDPFRAANYLQVETLYNWQFLSLEGAEVSASNGLTLSKTTPYKKTKHEFDLLVVNSSWTPEAFQDEALRTWLRLLARDGVSLAGIDTGAFVLAYAGLLDGFSATVHLEHAASFREFFPNTHLLETLYCIDKNRLSCAGGLAAADLSLELIKNHHGQQLANATANYILKDRLRHANEQQRTWTYPPLKSHTPSELKSAIHMMQENLEQALSLVRLAERLGVSQRKLERDFKKHFGVTPNRYCLSLRLERAYSLLTQTELSVSEIASACGFNSSEHFTRAYKKQFRTLPSVDKKEGRIPFQWRSSS